LPGATVTYADSARLFRKQKQRPAHDDALGAGRDDGISPDNVHPGEGRYCGEAQAGATALKGLDSWIPRHFSSLLFLLSSLAEAAGTAGDAGFRRQAECPSRIMLEFNDVGPGRMMLSDHAATV